MADDAQNKLSQTNNYSIISKYSCVKSGHYRDAILVEFIESWLQVKSWRRTALINRGYAARMMAVDWIVDRSIRFDGVDCFIVLGAGYDFLPFRHKHHDCSWIELDLPEVISTKSEFIRTNGVLGENDEVIHLENDIYSSVSSRFYMVGCDLRNCTMLASSLGKIFSSLRVKNVAVLNEVCLCYIDVKDISRILSTVINTVRQFAFRLYYIGYEQYKPIEDSPFSAVMSDHFSSMSFPLKHFSTSEQLRELFLGDLNFNHLTITPVHQIHNTALQEERETHQEAHSDQPFDEYEELSLYLSHYALVTGVLIFCDPFILKMDSSTAASKRSEVDDFEERLADMTLESVGGSADFVPSQIERYGHSSCAIEGQPNGSYSLIVSGGFGTSPRKSSIPHKRLNDCIVLKRNSGEENFSMKLVGTENINPNLIRLDRMHGQLVQIGSDKLFFNGGRQSPSKTEKPKVSFIVRLIEDNELELLHSLELANRFVRWRHKVCPINNSSQFIQVGGLTGSDNADPVVLWDLSADKLGAGTVQCPDYESFQRHSFAMDSLDNTKLIVLGGLQVSDRKKDCPVEADYNTILWDSRQGKIQAMNYDCANSYGCSVHFVNDFQLIKLAGISSKTGLAESTLQLLDLRSKERTPVAEHQLELADNQMILSNTSISNLKETRQIITTGGGGNYFTFGTRFNKSHLVYSYT